MFTSFPSMTLMAALPELLKIRLRMMSAQALRPKCFLWLSEKMDAMEEAKAIIARGGNPSLVIENYQRIVAANVARLSAKR